MNEEEMVGKFVISKRFNEGRSFETRQSGSGKTKAIGVENVLCLAIG